MNASSAAAITLGCVEWYTVTSPISGPELFDKRHSLLTRIGRLSSDMVPILHLFFFYFKDIGSDRKSEAARTAGM